MKSLLVVALLATPALADKEWSLEERGYFESLEKEIQQYADLTNKACESAITFELDKKTFKGIFNSKGKTGLDVFRLDAITEPFREVRYVCLEGKTQVEAVKKGITSLRLGFGTPPSQSLKKSTLTVLVPKAGNKRKWADDLKAFIKKQL